ncbi:hypothetical protein AWW66_22920 [Micromonospora rosaria]|uniref:Uncharacterized protein n=1 Tax=Micromonospora rosaria TaxID=47874 RepID=A0A136PMJ3_9ACTN|nr:hypothetical protein AWW66_22920 [Micromonospora rosaria]
MGWPRAGPPGYYLLEGLSRASMHGHLGLQLDDPPPSRDQLGVIGRGDTRHLTGVDQLLAAPVVDRLITDLHVPDQFCDRSAGLE